MVRAAEHLHPFLGDGMSNRPNHVYSSEAFPGLLLRLGSWLLKLTLLYLERVLLGTLRADTGSPFLHILNISPPIWAIPSLMVCVTLLALVL